MFCASIQSEFTCYFRRAQYFSVGITLTKFLLRGPCFLSNRSTFTDNIDAWFSHVVVVRIKNNQPLFSAFIYSHHHNRWLPLLYTTLTIHGRHEKHGQKSRFPVDKKGSDAWQCEKKPMWYKKVQKLKSTFYSSNYVVTGHALVVWKCNNVFFSWQFWSRDN